MFACRSVGLLLRYVFIESFGVNITVEKKHEKTNTHHSKDVRSIDLCVLNTHIAIFAQKREQQHD